MTLAYIASPAGFIARPATHARVEHAEPLGFLRSRPVARAVLALALLQPCQAYGKDLFTKARVVGVDKLEAMRGGFQAANGVEFSFGIDRAVYVNGQLVANTQLVLTNLERLLQGGMPLVKVLAGTQIVQNGAGNIVSTNAAQAAAAVAAAMPSPAVAIAAGAGTFGSPAVVPSAASSTESVVATPQTASTVSMASPQIAPAAVVAAPSSVAAATPAAGAPASTAATTLTPTSTFVVQTAAGPQTIVVPNAQAMVTAIQNSVNNQLIQTRTQIDATLSSLGAFRAATMSQAMGAAGVRP